MKATIMTTVLIAVALTSCAVDYSQASNMQLCDNVLNYTYMGYQRQLDQDARLNELSRRGEDCTSFVHLRR